MEKWETHAGPLNAPNADICCFFSLAADAGRAANSRQGPTFFCVVSHWHGRAIWLADDTVPVEPVWGRSNALPAVIFRLFTTPIAPPSAVTFFRFFPFHPPR